MEKEKQIYNIYDKITMDFLGQESLSEDDAKHKIIIEEVYLELVNG